MAASEEYAPEHLEVHAKDLDWWFSRKSLDVPAGKSKPIPMSALPTACKRVLALP